MKKTIIPVILFVFITGISLASINSGGKYLVKRGDSIYKIATKVFHIPWGDIRPEMRKKETIHPGQKFALSDLLDITQEKVWKNFNVKPFFYLLKIIHISRNIWIPMNICDCRSGAGFGLA